MRVRAIAAYVVGSTAVACIPDFGSNIDQGVIVIEVSRATGGGYQALPTATFYEDGQLTYAGLTADTCVHLAGSGAASDNRFAKQDREWWNGLDSTRVPTFTVGEVIEVASSANAVWRDSMRVAGFQYVNDYRLWTQSISVNPTDTLTFTWSGDGRFPGASVPIALVTPIDSFVIVAGASGMPATAEWWPAESTPGTKTHLKMTSTAYGTIYCTFVDNGTASFPLDISAAIGANPASWTATAGRRRLVFTDHAGRNESYLFAESTVPTVPIPPRSNTTPLGGVRAP